MPHPSVLGVTRLATAAPFASIISPTEWPAAAATRIRLPSAGAEEGTGSSQVPGPSQRALGELRPPAASSGSGRFFLLFFPRGPTLATRLPCPYVLTPPLPVLVFAAVQQHRDAHFLVPRPFSRRRPRPRRRASHVCRRRCRKCCGYYPPPPPFFLSPPPLPPWTPHSAF